MAKGKYEEYVKPNLDKVTEWAIDGLNNNQIAHNLGIKRSAFYDYLTKHSEFVDALKKGKAVSDYEVENSLFKRACGYEYDEVTQENKWNEDKEEYELITTKIVTKQVAPDPTSMIFWLKNRKPLEWRDKQEISQTITQMPITIVNDAD